MQIRFEVRVGVSDGSGKKSIFASRNFSNRFRLPFRRCVVDILSCFGNHPAVPFVWIFNAVSTITWWLFWCFFVSPLFSHQRKLPQSSNSSVARPKPHLISAVKIASNEVVRFHPWTSFLFNSPFIAKNGTRREHILSRFSLDYDEKGKKIVAINLLHTIGSCPYPVLNLTPLRHAREIITSSSGDKWT